MKIVHEELLHCTGDFAKSKQWRSLRKQIYDAVLRVDWPPRSGKFLLYPESGKLRGKGNGVVPIKAELMKFLKSSGWKLEQRVDLGTTKAVGKFDATLELDQGTVAFEWETGNISSSHRALNKMSLGLLKSKLRGGILVIPSRGMYKYLTDRIGNFAELEPYLDLWRSLPCSDGVLEILVIEQDGTSKKVPRIPKGKSGRAIP